MLIYTVYYFHHGFKMLVCDRAEMGSFQLKHSVTYILQHVMSYIDLFSCMGSILSSYHH